MNTAKWVALRWSLGFLTVLFGLVYWSNIPDRKNIQIQNLQNQNTALASDIRFLSHTVGYLRADLDRLKEEIQWKEERQRRALAESAKPD